MTLEEEIFKNCKFDFTKLLEYGFVILNNKYVYSKNILDDKFKLIINVDVENKITGHIYDLSIADEYIAYRIKDNEVRKAYLNILNDIKSKTTFLFKSRQANLIANLIKEKYNLNPECLWSNNNYGVFRNQNSNKWFGIIMDINFNKLDKTKNEEVDILNLKLDDMVPDLLTKNGIYSAYHLNKKKWISIVLNDTLNNDYIMIDELAHTNAIGSKNRKRYLDVIELLNNGINVYTTVNVQHLEGVNDLIDAKTNVDVSERIPDELFDLADEIAMIDIEPNELIERMKVGKIYKTNRIQVALSNFFKYDNLVSLREITMREMTDKLEKQKNNGIKPTKFLVLISPSPSSAKNIRVAARMGLTNHSKFQALYVETHSELSDESAKQLKKHMELVKSLGGEMIVKYADDVVSCIADYVRIGGVTNLIIGKTWQSIGKKMSFENKIIAHLPDIEVLIVPDKEQIKLPKKTFKERVLQFSRHRYIEKFKMANKALDFIRYLTIEIDVNNYKCSLEMISMLLSRTFKRSTIIKINDKAYTSYTNIEDQTLFETNIEKTAMSGVLINRTPAGRGTTLYEMQMVFISLLFTKIN